MSFKATLHVEDKEYKVLDCEYELSQAIDHKHKPTARPKGGLINLTVETSKEDATSDRFLFDWMASDGQIQNGHINFLKPDTMATLKKLEFSNAYCVNYKERFTGQGTEPMKIELIISAETIGLGGSSEHTNSWFKSSNVSQ